METEKQNQTEDVQEAIPEPKRLSAFGEWRRNNPDGAFKILDYGMFDEKPYMVKTKKGKWVWRLNKANKKQKQHWKQQKQQDYENKCRKNSN